MTTVTLWLVVPTESTSAVPSRLVSTAAVVTPKNYRPTGNNRRYWPKLVPLADAYLTPDTAIIAAAAEHMRKLETAKRIVEMHAEAIANTAVLRTEAYRGDSGAMTPQPIESHVWCDVHCAIHKRGSDPYDDGTRCDDSNWRAVFVNGYDGEEF